MLIRTKTKMREWNQSLKKITGNLMRSDGKYLKFKGNEENFIKNGAMVLEESISLFHGKANPIRHFSVNELNNLNVKSVSYYKDAYYDLHQGCWEGRLVIVKIAHHYMDAESMFVREIVVATQMATHNNAHKLLGCCLDTKCPVLIYEWVQAKTLEDRIIPRSGIQSEQSLEWKDKLRIAWEISHVVAYLHTAFCRSIIHRSLIPRNVLLDLDGAAKLCDFSFSIPIEEGKQFVQAIVAGTYGFIDPIYAYSGKVAESTDVYSFGVLLLVLLTGNHPFKSLGWLVKIVLLRITDNLASDIMDPSITRTGVTATEELQIRAFIQLALFCIAGEADSRPTMVEVATELNNMIAFPESIPTINRFQWSEYKYSDYSEWSDSENYASDEQEIGTLLGPLTKQSHSNIYSANSVLIADQIVDQELNNTSIVSRCNPRENVDSVMLPHDHVTVTITSNIEVEENEPLSASSFGESVAEEILISDVLCSNSCVIMEEHVSGKVQCGEKKAKGTNKDEMMSRRIKGQELGCLYSEPQELLIASEILECLPCSCKELHDIMALQPLETSIAVGFSADIFQYHDTQEEFEAYVTTHNVVHLLNMNWLKSSCLQIFIRYLQNKCKLLEVNSIGFMCPERLAMVKKHLIFTSQYIQYAISELHSKSYVLAPYYQENHWTLIVVCPQRHVALFFDPMGKNLDGLVIKRRINMVYRTCVQSELSPQSLTWKLVECPRQVNEAECGYYVMRYMYEIVTLYHQTLINLEECFELDSYTQQQINEVRDIWARYFIDECI